MRKSLLALVSVSLGLLAAESARATLYIEEGFGYDPALTMPSGFASNNIAGQNGGTGFQSQVGGTTNAWIGGSGNVWGQVVSPTLSYTDGGGRVLNTSGNSLQVGTNNNAVATANPQRVFTNSATAANLGNMAALSGGTIWMSFLYYREGSSTGAPFFRQANLGLYQGTGEKLDVGGPNTTASLPNNNLSLWSSGAGGTAHPQATALQSGVGVFSASAQLIVMRLTVDQTIANDGVEVWINPTDLTSLGAATLTSTAEVDLSGVNTLRFQAGNANSNGTNALMLVDEFRVGSSSGDVLPYTIVPEPTAIAFATIGGFALLALRRKFQK